MTLQELTARIDNCIVMLTPQKYSGISLNYIQNEVMGHAGVTKDLIVLVDNGFQSVDTNFQSVDSQITLLGDRVAVLEGA